MGDADLINKTRNNAIDGEIGSYLGLSAEQVVGGIGGTVVGLGAIALGNKVLPRYKSVPSKVKSDGSNKNSNSEPDNVDPQHGNSFYSDIKNYTEEYGKSQELRNSEIKNTSNLEKRRDSLVSQGKDTS